MDNNESWNSQVKFLWDVYKSGKKDNTETAEKHFSDVLKLIISLSTGMLAFIVAIHNKDHPFNISKVAETILICSFILAILFAVFAFVSLAVNYKKYADDNHKALRDLYRNTVNNKTDIIKDQIKKNDDEFLNSKDSGWQSLTIFLGILSLCFFIASIFYLLINFMREGIACH